MNQATSEYRGGDIEGSSPQNGTSRDDSNVLISSTAARGGLSSSSSEESINTFDRRGHQGSYFIRKASVHCNSCTCQFL